MISSTSAGHQQAEEEELKSPRGGPPALRHQRSSSVPQIPSMSHYSRESTDGGTTTVNTSAGEDNIVISPIGDENDNKKRYYHESNGGFLNYWSGLLFGNEAAVVAKKNEKLISENAGSVSRGSPSFASDEEKKLELKELTKKPHPPSVLTSSGDLLPLNERMGSMRSPSFSK
jgi:hypothetical protein